MKHGRTVSMEHLTQALDMLDPESRVLPDDRVDPAGDPDGDR